MTPSTSSLLEQNITRIEDYQREAAEILLFSEPMNVEIVGSLTKLSLMLISSSALKAFATAYLNDCRIVDCSCTACERVRMPVKGIGGRHDGLI